jgi:hypothetical protein
VPRYFNGKSLKHRPVLKRHQIIVKFQDSALLALNSRLTRNTCRRLGPLRYKGFAAAFALVVASNLAFVAEKLNLAT